jgi:hypothetical protein
MGDHSALQFHETGVVASVRRLSPYWLAQVAGWSAFALVTFLTLLPTVPPAIVPRLAATKVTRAVLGLLVSHLLYRLYVSRGLRLWMVGIVYGLGVSWFVLWVLVTSLWRVSGSPGLDWSSVPHQSLESVIVLAAWSAAYVGVTSWRRADLADRAAERAHLDALRYQLNPHFLFNALGSIRALILEDPQRARELVTGFADLLRQTLDTPERERPLEEEAAMIAQYLALERERFGDAIDVAIEIDQEAGRRLVPAFVLYPLVENAIIHGRRTSPPPLRVRLRAHASPERLRVEVANTGRLHGGDGHRPTGVASVRDRLALVYRDRQRFSLSEAEGWVRAAIEIDTPRR